MNVTEISAIKSLNGRDTQVSIPRNYLVFQPYITEYMQSSTLNKLLQAYDQLQQIANDLYEAAQQAMEDENYTDSSLLESRANRIFVEAENLDVLISELEGE